VNPSPADIPLAPARPTRAIVDLDRIASNLSVLRARVKGARVFPVVKANAYGHGAPAVAACLERSGADALCVALLEEGVELRREGISCPILVINALPPGLIGPAIEERITPTLYRTGLLEAVEAAGAKVGRPAGFHLKIDTGMTRLGLSPEELPGFLDRLTASRWARMEGIYSSLACADRPDDPLNAKQVAAYEACLRAIIARGLSCGIRHLANSSAISFLPGTLYDAVRPGILIYGVPPVAGDDAVPVLPALTLVTEVAQIRAVPAGTPVGYAASWRAEGPRTLAVLPAGYDDGMIRSLSNQGVVLVNGLPAPVIGRVSMDLSVVDVTACGTVREGDEAVLIGSQGSGTITAWDVARRAGTIPWEVLCRVGGRVPRDYVREGHPAGRWSRWERHA
jgi:alanine racemase